MDDIIQIKDIKTMLDQSGFDQFDFSIRLKNQHVYQFSLMSDNEKLTKVKPVEIEKI